MGGQEDPSRRIAGGAPLVAGGTPRAFPCAVGRGGALGRTRVAPGGEAGGTLAGGFAPCANQTPDWTRKNAPRGLAARRDVALQRGQRERSIAPRFFHA